MTRDVTHYADCEVRWGSPGDGRYPVTERFQRVDEIVATDVRSLHLEAMGESTWWIGLTLSDGTELMVNLGSVSGRAPGVCMVGEDR